jgi:Tfp pilus assembly PilM family ATPase
LARFLALDWDHHQLHVVSATVKHGGLKIHKALVLPEPQTPNLAEAEAMGARLRDLLKAEGMAPAPVLACVGRDRLILKELRYPAVPAAEEPAIVRFQAVKELSHAPEEVVIDYTPSGEPGPGGDKQALVVVLRRELLTAYQSLCRVAGLKLAAVSPRAFGTALCLRTKAGQAGEAIAVVTRAEEWAEFCVVRDGELLFSRGLTALAPGGDAAFLSELRRNLAVYASQVPKHPVKAIVLSDGGKYPALREQLQRTAGLPVHEFDPLAGQMQAEVPLEKRGGFTGAVGLLLAQSERRAVPIDFLHPKQPTAPVDTHRWKAVAAAAVAAVLLLGGAVAAYSHLASKDRIIRQLNLVKMDLDGQLVQIEEDAKRIKALGDWADAEVIWLDELYDLTDVFPEGNQMRLASLTGGELLSRTGKDKHVARMALKGVSNDRQPVNRLMNELTAEPTYRVTSEGMERNQSVERNRFLQQYRLRVDLEKRPPDKYTRHFSPPAPEAQRGQGMGAGEFPGFGFGEGQ